MNDVNCSFSELNSCILYKNNKTKTLDFGNQKKNCFALFTLNIVRFNWITLYLYLKKATG